jgi:hypothetical protein
LPPLSASNDPVGSDRVQVMHEDCHVETFGLGKERIKKRITRRLAGDVASDLDAGEAR